MPYQVMDLGTLVVATSGNAAVTSALGHLDDAKSLTIFVTSSANWSSTGAGGIVVQVSQFDPADSLFSTQYVSRSTAWFPLVNSSGGTTVVTSSGIAMLITNVSFRGIRLSNLTCVSSTDSTVARVSKQVTV